MDDLREKLRLSEERAQQNYDEMNEYQSWLQQVEEGQETLKGAIPCPLCYLGGPYFWQTQTVIA